MVPCEQCGIDVYGDDDAHVLLLPVGYIAFCPTCWAEFCRKLGRRERRASA